MKNFKEKYLDAVQRLLIFFTKPLFFTFIFGNMLIFLKVIEKPSFLNWCIGTSSLLIGGGAIKVGKAYRDKFIK